MSITDTRRDLSAPLSLVSMQRLTPKPESAETTVVLSGELWNAFDFSELQGHPTRQRALAFGIASGKSGQTSGGTTGLGGRLQVQTVRCPAARG